MIKNIIFDIGGVLVEFNSKNSFDKLGIKENVKELNKIIYHSEKFKECLNGFITSKELIEYLAKNNPKYTTEIEKILDYDNLKYSLPPKNDMISYYNELKNKGFEIYLCSNITEDTYNYIKTSFNIIQQADGGVFSCFENVSKPNIKIYENLINKYKLNASESLFIDDTKRNIEMAKQIGFKTLLFQNLEQLKKIIER